MEGQTRGVGGALLRFNNNNKQRKLFQIYYRILSSHAKREKCVIPNFGIKKSTKVVGFRS
eukprot:scaffold43153_cov176-Amphora_coffeaeformis.AAC.4